MSPNSILGKMTRLKDLEVHLAVLKHDLEHMQVKFEQEEETPNDKLEAKENDSTREHICLYLLNWLLKNKQRNKHSAFQAGISIFSTSISARCSSVHDSPETLKRNKQLHLTHQMFY